MRYIDQTRKELTLPSGAKVTVRQRTRREDIEIGPPPSWFRKHKDGDETTPEQDMSLTKYLSQVELVLLTRCLAGPLQFGEESLTVSSVDPGKEKSGEISWMDITQEDREAILSGINSISQAGREARSTFPEANKGTEGPA